MRTIAARFGVHRGSVPVLARQAGVPAREPGQDVSRRARAAALYGFGLALAPVVVPGG
ncbi:MAG: hypothetical protein QM607_13020 [Microbacterium sp.]